MPGPACYRIYIVGSALTCCLIATGILKLSWAYCVMQLGHPIISKGGVAWSSPYFKIKKIGSVWWVRLSWSTLNSFLIELVFPGSHLHATWVPHVLFAGIMECGHFTTCMVVDKLLNFVRDCELFEEICPPGGHEVEKKHRSQKPRTCDQEFPRQF